MAIRRISYAGQCLEIAYIKQACQKTQEPRNIVFLHGWGSHKELMHQAFGGSFADYTHYYIDLPGFGASPYGEELESTFDTPAARRQKVDSSLHAQGLRILDTSDYAHIVLAFLRELGIRADIIVGHSFGGKVAVLCGKLDSALGSHSADFGDFLKKHRLTPSGIPCFRTTADLMSSSALKSPKNYESNTATPRILEEDNQGSFEKSALNQKQPQSKKVDSSVKLDSSPNAPFSVIASRDSGVAKQGAAAASLVIHKNNTQNTHSLESTFENNADILKVDSRNNTESVKTPQNTRVENVFDKQAQRLGELQNDNAHTRVENVFDKQAQRLGELQNDNAHTRVENVFDKQAQRLGELQNDNAQRLHKLRDSRIVELESGFFKPHKEIRLERLSTKCGEEIHDSSPQAESHTHIGDIMLLSSAGIVCKKPFKVRAKIACAKIAKALHIRLPFLRASDAKSLNPTMYSIFKRVVNEDFSPIFAACRHNVSIFWGRNDTATPLESGEQIHALIPSSRLFVLEGDHYFFINQATRIESMYHSQAWHIKVCGKVQGVGYRKFAKAKADELGLKGSAQNLPDGSVEIFVCGDESGAARFLQALWVGPSKSQVQEVHSEPCVLKQEWLAGGFRILT